MKTFNLEKALAGEPVVYQNGEEVLDVKQFVNGAVVSLGKDGTYRKHNVGGALIAPDIGFINVEDYHLFMAEKPKVKREGWVNVYKSSLGEYCVSGRVHESFLDATGLCINQVATVKIEWEEEAE